MQTLIDEKFSQILQGVAEALDVPDAMYQKAEDKYNEVGRWLAQPYSALVLYDPDIYAQGSFALGTAIRPVTEMDEYDIDAVCQLDLSKEDVSQQELKAMVGDRLKENGVYARIIKEKRRCWTLEYSNSTRFHMDILPAIPNSNGSPGSIFITDKELFHWQHSNPRGYAEWFKVQMREHAQVQLERLAESLRMDVSKIPYWRVKTPLQRIVQLLKRHRDFHFLNDKDDKPISIIITTLAAEAYRGEADILDAVLNVLLRMPEYIRERDGISWVPNPVNPQENFADKWKGHPQRERKFRQWLNKVRSDLSGAMDKRGLDEVAKSLAPYFGTRPVNEAMVSLGESMRNSRISGTARMSAGGVLGTSGATPVKDHTFFGC